MKHGRFRASRTRVRLALALGVVVSASAYSVSSIKKRDARAPAFVMNDSAQPPRVTQIAGVTHVVSTAARQRIVPDTAMPDGGARASLVWLNGRVTSPTSEGTVVIDPGGSVVVFDRNLSPHRPVLALDGREVAEVASGGSLLAACAEVCA